MSRILYGCLLAALVYLVPCASATAAGPWISKILVDMNLDCELDTLVIENTSNEQAMLVRIDWGSLDLAACADAMYADTNLYFYPSTVVAYTGGYTNIRTWILLRDVDGDTKKDMVLHIGAKNGSSDTVAMVAIMAQPGLDQMDELFPMDITAPMTMPYIAKPLVIGTNITAGRLNQRSGIVIQEWITPPSPLVQHQEQGSRNPVIQDMPVHDMNVVVFPNPASNTVTVRLTSPLSLIECSVVDIFGREVLRLAEENVPMARREMTLDVAHLTDGAYRILLTDGTGAIVSRPITIAR